LKAIRELKEASDRRRAKRPRGSPAGRCGLVWGDRMHKSLERCSEERASDVNEKEDNAFARGAQGPRDRPHRRRRARHQGGHRGIPANATRPRGRGHRDPVPPRDHRFCAFARGAARSPRVRRDAVGEQNAIRRDRGALKEIQERPRSTTASRSRITPAVDAKLHHRDRLKQAMECSRSLRET